jgi:hypothetical protein
MRGDGLLDRANLATSISQRQEKSIGSESGYHLASNGMEFEAY